MKEFIVNKKNSNIKVSNCIKNIFPEVPISKIHMAIRNKDIRINSTKISKDYIINENDIVTIYMPDYILFNIPQKLEIIYEDNNILVINKPSNLLSERNINSNILEPNAEDIIIKQCNDDNIKLCHRLDRNTSGLLVFSKNTASYNELLLAFKEGYIIKRYLAYVNGIPKEHQKILTDYLYKDPKKSLVTISSSPKNNFEKIITEYFLIETYDNYSLLEVIIHTGKTHQIRAHLAYHNLPIIGDGKYGNYEINKKFKDKFKTQALNAYKYEFKFPDNFRLNYLNTKIIKLPNVSL